MLASLSENTYKQYHGCIKAWISYCNKYKHDYTSASIPIVLHFLTDVFDNGAKYGTINSCKSALALLLGFTSDDYRIKRFMKGVFRLRPSRPKYNITWDPNIVLNYLANKWPNEDLNLETLSKKTLTLLALVTAHRMQTLSLIKLTNIETRAPTEIIIKIPDLVKTSKPNSFQPLLRLPFYDARPEICPARCIQAYINKTTSLRKDTCDFLFISYKRPHSKVKSQTLSTWLKNSLCCSGVNTEVFTAHSTRHAATSTASRVGVSIDVIRKTAGWSESSSVFAKFYNREIVANTDKFARSILSNFDSQSQ